MDKNSVPNLMDEEIDLMPSTPESDEKRHFPTVEEEALKLADYFTASSIKIAQAISVRAERRHRKTNGQLEEESIFEVENEESEEDEDNVPTANLLGLSPIGTRRQRRTLGTAELEDMFGFEMTPFSVKKRGPLRRTLGPSNNDVSTKSVNVVLPDTVDPTPRNLPVNTTLKLPVEAGSVGAAVSRQNSTKVKPAQVVKPNIRAVVNEGPVTRRSVRLSTVPSKTVSAANRASTSASQSTLKPSTQNVGRPNSKVQTTSIKSGNSKHLLAKSSGTGPKDSKLRDSVPPHPKKTVSVTPGISEPKLKQTKPTALRASTANSNRILTRNSAALVPKADMKKPPSNRTHTSSRRTSVSTSNAENRNPLIRKSTK